jgi:hypothetical protein
MPHHLCVLSKKKKWSPTPHHTPADGTARPPVCIPGFGTSARSSTTANLRPVSCLLAKKEVRIRILCTQPVPVLAGCRRRSTLFLLPSSREGHVQISVSAPRARSQARPALPARLRNGEDEARQDWQIGGSHARHGLSNRTRLEPRTGGGTHSRTPRLRPPRTRPRWHALVPINGRPETLPTSQVRESHLAVASAKNGKFTGTANALRGPNRPFPRGAVAPLLPVARLFPHPPSPSIG